MSASPTIDTIMFSCGPWSGRGHGGRAAGSKRHDTLLRLESDASMAGCTGSVAGLQSEKAGSETWRDLSRGVRHGVREREHRQL